MYQSWVRNRVEVRTVNLCTFALQNLSRLQISEHRVVISTYYRNFQVPLRLPNTHRRTRHVDHQQQNAFCIRKHKEQSGSANVRATVPLRETEFYRAKLPPPAPASTGDGLGRLRAGEDLRPQHRRRPDAAGAVLEAELAGVLELDEELVGDVPWHHLHRARRRRRVVTRRRWR
jgi:hypothetical protein